MRFYGTFPPGFALEASEQIAHDYPDAQLERLRQFLALLDGSQPLSMAPLQRPNDLFFPGLTDQPWIDSHTYAATKRVAEKLEQHLPALRAEFFQTVDDSAFSMTTYQSTSRFAGLRPDEWTSLTLWQRGVFEPVAERFPVASSLIRELENALFPWRGEVAFMRLLPGSRLPPHYDWTNAQLTCHVAIDAPPDCGMRVGSESRQWCDHPVLFFDHSFEHEVWNDSDRARTILLLNLRHPLLTTLEQSVINELFGPSS